MYKLTYFYFTL